MSTWTEIYSAAKSISRNWFPANNPSGATIYNSFAVPTGAKVAIISTVGAGGWLTNSSVPGGGAAFARKKLTDLTDGELFTIQIGSTLYTFGTGTSAGDTIITRNNGSVVVCKAARGLAAGPGLIADCIGDTKRDGFAADVSNQAGGKSGGDANDDYSLGFGGRGARVGRTAAAGWGGGGIHRVTYDGQGNIKSFFPGAGRACIEFFTKDPGYV